MRLRQTWLLQLMASLLGLPAGVAGSSEGFPFQFREGLLWVEALTAESPSPLSFLLDTGAGVSVIDLHTAERLKLKPGRRVSVQGVCAHTTGFWPESLTARAGEVLLPHNYLAVDLNTLSSACKCRVDGLIGADFFGGRVVEIDFAAHRVRLLASLPRAAKGVVVPLKARQGSLRVAVRVEGGAPQWFRVDTGCSSSLQWVHSRTPTREASSQPAFGLVSSSIAQTQTSLQLGGVRFEGVATGLHDKPLFAGEAGLVGNGLLSRFDSVTIDAIAGRVLLRNRP